MGEQSRPPLLVTISGPSGVGKDVVLDGLKRRGLDLTHVVTVTTRKPRDGEVDGVNYIFLKDSKEFERLIADNKLLEHALVHGDYKGVLREPVEQALARGEDVVLQVNVDGAETIRRLIPEALTIFLQPESLEALAERRKRRGMTDEEIARRAADAEEELRRAGDFDHVVINREGRLDDTVLEVAEVISDEQSRPGRQRPVVRE